VRGGGIGLAFGTLVALAVAASWIFGSADIALCVAGISFGAIGFADDLTSRISIRARMILQLVAALLVMTLIRSHHSFGVVPLVFAGFLVTVWIISFVNAFNFMDGINGISCAEGIVAGVTFGFIARYEHQYALQAAGFALAAGAIGFAPFNFPKARIFLGDVGSYFVGSWIATMVVIGLQASIPVDAMVAPVMLYVADSGLTLARRVLRHEAWHEAHRQHTYQRLVDRGLSHTQTTGLVFVVVALSSALGSISLFDSLQARLVADVGIAVLTTGYLALPSLIDHFWDDSSSPGHVVSDG